MPDEQRDWSVFALLLIDVQHDFWKDGMSMPRETYESNVARLLRVCRSENIDIVHLRASFKADKSDWMLRYKYLDKIPCIENTPGAEPFDCGAAQNSEPVLYKQSFDGFHNPELEQVLRAGGKEFLLVAGLVTSVCVLLTAATAAQRGYLVAAVEDCCADQPGAHEHTLQRYPFVFDRVGSNAIPDHFAAWREMLAAKAGQ
ncbi:MAG: cysteine hydrolase [Gammaproteobacteria bacterium]|nr:cysteine hydrolase [Gammaproteobacteria bacterium]